MSEHRRPVPISDCDVRDPRMRRTRNLLQDALQMLLHSKKFEEISVQDIADAATVNRATFYDHYGDKFALLDAMVAGGFHQLLEQRKVSYNGTCPGASRAIILAACDFLTQCETSRPGRQNQVAFEPLIDAAIVRAIRRVLFEGVPKASKDQCVSPELIAASASWAIYGAVKEWSVTPRRSAAEEIVPLFQKLVHPILQIADPPHREPASKRRSVGRHARA
jgi:AcrR family transcriptional regulator